MHIYMPTHTHIWNNKIIKLRKNAVHVNASSNYKPFSPKEEDKHERGRESL